MVFFSSFFFSIPGNLEIIDNVPGETVATAFRAKAASTDEVNFIVGEGLLQEKCLWKENMELDW